MAVYHKIKELAPEFSQKLQVRHANHDARTAELTPRSGRSSFIADLMAQGYNLRTTMKQTNTACHGP
eukprot:9688505-Lingulodinium_polyedra.AAC.1